MIRSANPRYEGSKFNGKKIEERKNLEGKYSISALLKKEIAGDRSGIDLADRATTWLSVG